MLRKKKHSKDNGRLGYGTDEFSTSKETSHKGKRKIGEDSFTGNRNMRRQPRRPFTSRRQEYVVTHTSCQEWKKERSNGRPIENGKPWIHSQKNRNSEVKPVKSPHVSQNNFVSNKPPFSRYFPKCKGFGYRVEECKIRPKNRLGIPPRNNMLDCKRRNAFEHKLLDCRNMCMPTPGYANKNPLTTPRNANVVCYDCNGFGHRNYECRKKKSPSYGN